MSAEACESPLIPDGGRGTGGGLGVRRHPPPPLPPPPLLEPLSAEKSARVILTLLSRLQRVRSTCARFDPACPSDEVAGPARLGLLP